MLCAISGRRYAYNKNKRSSLSWKKSPEKTCMNIWRAAILVTDSKEAGAAWKIPVCSRKRSLGGGDFRSVVAQVRVLAVCGHRQGCGIGCGPGQNIDSEWIVAADVAAIGRHAITSVWVADDGESHGRAGAWQIRKRTEWSTNKKFHQCKGRRLCKGTSNDNPESILAFAHVCNVVNEICFSSVKSWSKCGDQYSTNLQLILRHSLPCPSCTECQTPPHNWRSCCSNKKRTHKHRTHQLHRRWSSNWSFRLP